MTVNAFGAVFLVLLCLSAQAQDDITALRRELTAAQTDTSRSRLFYSMGVAYEEVDHDSSLYFLSRSLQVAQQNHDLRATANAMYRLGYLYTYYLNDNAKALEWLNKGIAVAQKNHDTLNLSRCYQYIAVVAFYQHTGNAEEIIKHALGYAQKTGDWRSLHYSYVIMSMIQKGQHNYNQAEISNLQSMKACEPYSFDLWFSTGLDYCKQLKQNGKPEQARLFYRKLDAVKHKLTLSNGYHNYIYNLAALAIGLQDYARAEELLEKSLTFEKEKPKPDTFRLVNIENTLLDVYVNQRDYKRSYELDKECAAMRLWLQQKRLTRTTQVKLMQLKADLDMEKKEHEITVLAEQQNQQQIYLIGAILVATLLLGFLFVLQRNRQRIDRQRAELGYLNTTKDKLFAILSHDLRSPVASLKNYLMLINWGALSKEEFAESAEDLTGQFNNVHTMLENVLNWSVSQMEGIHPKVESLHLAPIIEEQIQVILPVAQAKGIHITNLIPAEAQLNADKNHIAVIFRNLLQNALKFTNPGGTVRFTYAQTNGLHTIAVQDTGIGMSRTLIENLFRLGNSPSRMGTAHEQGTGLGLVLVEELVNVNQGQIRVDSEPDKGTTFTLTFA